MECIPVMTGCVVRIDLERATVLSFGDCPVEVMTHGSEAERAVSFGGRRVKFDSLGGCLFCGARTFSERFQTKHAEPVVVIGYAGVGKRVIGTRLVSFWEE